MENKINDAAETPARMASAENEAGLNRKDERRQEERRQDERRRHLRYAASAQTEGIELESRAHFAGRTSDISLSGAYIDTMTSFQVGCALKLRIKTDGKSFDTRAYVTISSPGMGVGVRFVETEADQLEILKGWILRLSGEERAAEPDFAEAQEHSPAGSRSGDATVANTLSDLILELISSGVLPERKGRALLETLAATGRH